MNAKLLLASAAVALGSIGAAEILKPAEAQAAGRQVAVLAQQQTALQGALQISGIGGVNISDELMKRVADEARKTRGADADQIVTLLEGLRHPVGFSTGTASGSRAAAKTYDQLLAESRAAVSRIASDGGQFTTDLKKQNDEPKKFLFNSFANTGQEMNRALGLGAKGNFLDIVGAIDAGISLSGVDFKNIKDIGNFIISQGLPIGVVGGVFDLIDAINSGDIGNIVVNATALIAAVLSALGHLLPAAGTAGLIIGVVAAIAAIVYNLIKNWDAVWEGSDAKFEKLLKALKGARDEQFKEAHLTILRDEIAPELEQVWQTYQQSVARSATQVEATLDLMTERAPDAEKPAVKMKADAVKDKLRDNVATLLKDAAPGMRSALADKVVEAMTNSARGLGSFGPQEGHVYHLRIGASPRLLVDAGPNDSVNTWRDNGQPNQQWKLTKRGVTNGIQYWSLQEQRSKKCLSAYAGEPKKAIVGDCSMDNARWEIRHDGIADKGEPSFKLLNKVHHDSSGNNPGQNLRYLIGVERRDEPGKQLETSNRTGGNNEDVSDWFYLDDLSAPSGYMSFTEKFVEHNRDEVLSGLQTAGQVVDEGPDYSRPKARERALDKLGAYMLRDRPALPNKAEVERIAGASGRFQPMVIQTGRVIKNVHSGKAVDVTSDGKVVQWDSHGQPNQRWKILEVTGNGSVQLQEQGPFKKCLNTNGPRLLQTSSCKDGYDDQLWKPEQQADGSYKIVHTRDNKVLTVPNSSTSAGTELELAIDEGKPNQRFQFETQLTARSLDRSADPNDSGSSPTSQTVSVNSFGNGYTAKPGEVVGKDGKDGLKTEVRRGGEPAKGVGVAFTVPEDGGLYFDHDGKHVTTVTVTTGDDGTATAPLLHAGDKEGDFTVTMTAVTEPGATDGEHPTGTYTVRVKK